jgi:hypothetical protein
MKIKKKEELCSNCGSALGGEFCHTCGQSSKSMIKFFGEVMVELLDDTLGYDSRLKNSIFLLLFRPGRITLDYIRGKRFHYVLPFKLYLITSVLFILLIKNVIDTEQLKLHFHMLFLDGVYAKNKYGKAIFQRTNTPTQEALAQLVHTVSHRVARYLERQGILQRDEESSYLQLDGIDDDPMQPLIGCSVSYRIAVGPQQGRKVLTLQTFPSVEADDRYAQVAKEAGFSLQAGVAAQAWERDKLERLCRYISRPAVSEKRLSLTSAGNIRYQLKTAYRDGTTHVIFEPLDFISKLASLVPNRESTSRGFTVFLHPTVSTG